MNVDLSGNLVAYGIHQEQSDYRCHVCYGEGHLYIYPTSAGIEACDSGHYRKASATQPGVDCITAEGYLVPPTAIRDCDRVQLPPDLLAAALKRISEHSSTTEKGDLTAKLVKIMLRRRLIPLSIGSEEVGDQKMQIEGVDIYIDSRFRIQVKCDWRGGISGTGNLFLQTAECNPLRRH